MGNGTLGLYYRGVRYLYWNKVIGVYVMNYVNYADKKQLAGVKGFNDKEQRDAFKRMVKSCPVLYEYLYEYFNMTQTNHTKS